MHLASSLCAYVQPRTHLTRHLMTISMKHRYSQWHILQEMCLVGALYRTIHIEKYVNEVQLDQGHHVVVNISIIANWPNPYNYVTLWLIRTWLHIWHSSQRNHQLNLTLFAINWKSSTTPTFYIVHVCDKYSHVHAWTVRRQCHKEVSLEFASPPFPPAGFSKSRCHMQFYIYAHVENKYNAYVFI